MEAIEVDHRLIAAAAASASRGMIEYELRTWPVAAAAAGLGLSLAVRALPDRRDVLIVSAAVLALIALMPADRLDGDRGIRP